MSPSDRLGWRIGRGLVSALVAAVFGLVGTFGYWNTVALGSWRQFPIGLIAGCLAMAAVGTFLRAWAGFAGVAGACLGAFAVTQGLTLPGPGGDLVVAAVPLAYIWLVAAPALCLAPAFAPRRWFARAIPRPLATPGAPGHLEYREGETNFGGEESGP